MYAFPEAGSPPEAPPPFSCSAAVTLGAGVEGVDVLRTTGRELWRSWRRALGEGGAVEPPPPRLITPEETLVSFPEARVPVEPPSSLIVDERWREDVEEE